MRIIDDYRATLSQNLQLEKGVGATAHKVDKIVLAARYGSQAAFDALVDHWVNFSASSGSCLDLATHPAIHILRVSDNDSSFANQQLFKDSLFELLMANHDFLGQGPNDLSERYGGIGHYKLDQSIIGFSTNSFIHEMGYECSILMATLLFETEQNLHFHENYFKDWGYQNARGFVFRAALEYLSSHPDCCRREDGAYTDRPHIILGVKDILSPLLTMSHFNGLPSVSIKTLEQSQRNLEAEILFVSGFDYRLAESDSDRKNFFKQPQEVDSFKRSLLAVMERLMIYEFLLGNAAISLEDGIQTVNFSKIPISGNINQNYIPKIQNLSTIGLHILGAAIALSSALKHSLKWFQIDLDKNSEHLRSSVLDGAEDLQWILHEYFQLILDMDRISEDLLAKDDRLYLYKDFHLKKETYTRVRWEKLSVPN